MDLDSLSAVADKVARQLPESQLVALANEIQRCDAATGAAEARAVSVIPSPEFAAQASLMVNAWRQHAPDLTGSAVALALRAAARAAEAIRGLEEIDVVWTGPPTPGVSVRLTRSAMLDVIRSSKRSLIVVSFAAYKVELVIEELIAAESRGVQIHLVLEEREASGGRLSIDASDAFEALEGSATFYVWPSDKRPVLTSGQAALHAKAAIADDHTALVTSANLTGHGIAENMELGLMVRGGPIPKRLARHFRQLMEAGVLKPVD